MFTYLTKGHRSIIYKGMLKGKKVIKKVEKSKAINRIQNEIKYLKLLEPYGFTPKLYQEHQNYFVAEYIEGQTIEEFFKTATKKQIQTAIKKIILQCRRLDQLHIEKKEMSNPYKHIIIHKHPKMIDFERARFCTHPKNVTSFVQYLQSGKINFLLHKKEIIYSIDLKLLQEYKRDQSHKNFLRIFKALTKKDT